MSTRDDTVSEFHFSKKRKMSCAIVSMSVDQTLFIRLNYVNCRYIYCSRNSVHMKFKVTKTVFNKLNSFKITKKHLSRAFSTLSNWLLFFNNVLFSCLNKRRLASIKYSLLINPVLNKPLTSSKHRHIFINKSLTEFQTSHQNSSPNRTTTTD